MRSDKHSKKLATIQKKLHSSFLDQEIRDRVAIERRAHSKDDVLSRSYTLKNRYSHICGYPSRLRLDKALLGYLTNLNGKKILDYGCGWGEFSLYLLNRGAEVRGIDISSIYIDDARNRCHEAGYNASKCSFYVMDAHSIGFSNNTFDLVVGLGILHHLEIDVALKEIHRVLKPDGRALLQEPLADNPLLKIFRKLTPNARTKKECPLSKKDISRLKRSPDWKVEMCFCGIIELPAALITSLLMPGQPANFLLREADRLEQRMHAHSFFDSWNQYVLLNLIKIPTC